MFLNPNTDQQLNSIFFAIVHLTTSWVKCNWGQTITALRSLLCLGLISQEDGKVRWRRKGAQNSLDSVLIWPYLGFLYCVRCLSVTFPCACQIRPSSFTLSTRYLNVQVRFSSNSFRVLPSHHRLIHFFCIHKLLFVIVRTWNRYCYTFSFCAYQRTQLVKWVHTIAALPPVLVKLQLAQR